MKMHYSLIENSSFPNCGIEILKANVTNTIDEVTCKNCLRSIISFNHQMIIDLSKAIKDVADDLRKAQKRLYRESMVKYDGITRRELQRWRKDN